ncbi:hypothetical protein ACTZWT_20000 [Rhodopseudomonas sp. NSM]
MFMPDYAEIAGRHRCRGEIFLFVDLFKMKWIDVGGNGVWPELGRSLWPDRAQQSERRPYSVTLGSGGAGGRGEGGGERLLIG